MQGTVLAFQPIILRLDSSSANKGWTKHIEDPAKIRRFAKFGLFRIAVSAVAWSYSYSLSQPLYMGSKDVASGHLFSSEPLICEVRQMRVFEHETTSALFVL